MAACYLQPEPYTERPCTRIHQTGHRNKPWGKQTEEEWTVEVSLVVFDVSISGKMNLFIVCVQTGFYQIRLQIEKNIRRKDEHKTFIHENFQQ